MLRGCSGDAPGMHRGCSGSRTCPELGAASLHSAPERASQGVREPVWRPGEEMPVPGSVPRAPRSKRRRPPRAQGSAALPLPQPGRRPPLPSGRSLSVSLPLSLSLLTQKPLHIPAGQPGGSSTSPKPGAAGSPGGRCARGRCRRSPLLRVGFGDRGKGGMMNKQHHTEGSWRRGGERTDEYFRVFRLEVLGSQIPWQV